MQQADSTGKSNVRETRILSDGDDGWQVCGRCTIEQPDGVRSRRRSFAKSVDALLSACPSGRAEKPARRGKRTDAANERVERKRQQGDGRHRTFVCIQHVEWTMDCLLYAC